METCESEKSYSYVLECSHQKFKCTSIIQIWKLTSNKHFHVLNARSVKFHKNPAILVALRNCVNVSYTTDNFCIWTRRTRSIYVNHKNPRTRTRRNTAVSMEEPPLPMTSLLESAQQHPPTRDPDGGAARRPNRLVDWNSKEHLSVSLLRAQPPTVVDTRVAHAHGKTHEEHARHRRLIRGVSCGHPSNPPNNSLECLQF